jgi:hypothetical protein
VMARQAIHEAPQLRHSALVEAQPCARMVTRSDRHSGQ